MGIATWSSLLTAHARVGVVHIFNYLTMYNHTTDKIGELELTLTQEVLNVQKVIRTTQISREDTKNNLWLL